MIHLGDNFCRLTYHCKITFFSRPFFSFSLEVTMPLTMLLVHLLHVVTSDIISNSSNHRFTPAIPFLAALGGPATSTEDLRHQRSLNKYLK